MKLKELKTMISGKVALYEEKESFANYVDIYVGDCMYIPQELLKREVIVIGGVSYLGEGRLEIQLGAG